MVAVGVLFIASGPSLAIWLVILQRQAQLLVIGILSAFTWCLAMIFTGLIWLAIPPLKDTYPWTIFVAVTLQEALRLFLFGVFRFMERRSEDTEVFLRVGAKNEVLSGLAVGLGYALMSVLIQFYSILIDEFLDDTAIYIEGCPLNFFVAGAAFSLAFSILQMSLAVWLWSIYFEENRWVKILVGFAVHLAISETALLNLIQNGCTWNLGVTWALVILVAVVVMWVSKERIRKDTTAS